jgi:hypothetical protein
VEDAWRQVVHVLGDEDGQAPEVILGGLHESLPVDKAALCGELVTKDAVHTVFGTLVVLHRSVFLVPFLHLLVLHALHGGGAGGLHPEPGPGDGDEHVDMRVSVSVGDSPTLTINVNRRL